jgi:magnesium chelatase family protein
MAETVLGAREQQLRRNGAKLNAHLLPDEIKMHCRMSPGAAEYLDQCLKRYPFSGRGYTRILKMARTLADLEAAETIAAEHVEKAVMFRVLDRLKHSEEC